MAKVNISLDLEKENIILSSARELSFTVLRELVGYQELTDEKEEYTYRVPIFSNNCFVLSCLIIKYNKTFSCEESLFNSLKIEANKLPRPSCQVLNNNYIGIKCPPIDAYMRLMGTAGAYPMMRNQYKIPFTRLYEGYRILSGWSHPFLPSFYIYENLKELIHFPLTKGNMMKDILSVTLPELYSIHYGYQIKQEGFSKLKYENASDILFSRPIRYLDRANLQSWNKIHYGEPSFIRGQIVLINGTLSNKLYIVIIEEQSQKEIEVSFFGKGFLTKSYKEGDYCIAQLVKVGKLNGNGIDIFSLDEVQSMPIVPIYKQSPSNRITTKVLTQCVEEIFSRFKGDNLAYYVKSLKKPLWELLYELHFPKNVAEYLDTINNLAYLELFYLQLIFIEKKNNEEKYAGIPKHPTGKTNYTKEAIQSLPFELTNDQKEELLMKLKVD
ncbi:hypothetical protein [Eggerthia catenaformis]